MSKFFKRTKIVATLGPKSDNKETIKKLILSGANVFRLNTSHGEMADHQKRVDMIREVSDELNVFVGIMVDLQGPKIRIGQLKEEISFEVGDEIIFSHNIEHNKNQIPVDYCGISDDVNIGDKILMDDGKLSAIVKKVENDKVYAEILNSGILKSRKGLNIPGSTASLNAVTERDIEFIKFAARNDVEYIALSFVRTKEDVLMAKKYIEKFEGREIAIISKIEKPEAIENLKEIVENSDYVMVARGDLGIELSPVEVPIAQKNIIREANKQRKGVIVATQMLETMITEPIPTRAESSDIANAILDGADAIMLSAETSIGNYAVEAVQMMAEIAHSTEGSKFYNYDIEMEISNKYTLTRQAIVIGADKMVKYVNAKALISFSHRGISSRLMSKLKPSVPIIAISDVKKTCRQLSLNWGVYPVLKAWDIVVNQNVLSGIDELLMDKFNFKKDEYVIITGSAPKLMSGRTNFTRVHRICAEVENFTL